MARELLESGNNKLVMVFLCGLLRKNNYTLVELLDIIKDNTYLPLLPIESLSLHDVSENHNSHTFFHCLREVDTLRSDDVSGLESHPPALLTHGVTQRKSSADVLLDKFGARVIDCKIEQISLSYPWCSAECLEGTTKLFSLVDKHCMSCQPATPTGSQQHKQQKDESNVASRKQSLEMFKTNQEVKKSIAISRRGNTAALSRQSSQEEKDLNNKLQQSSLTQPSSELTTKSVTKASQNALTPSQEAQWSTSKPSVLVRRPKSLDSVLDDAWLDEAEVNTSGSAKKLSKNFKLHFQRTLGSSKVVDRSCIDSVKCRKFSVTSPAALVAERTTLFSKFLLEAIQYRHFESLIVHDITTLRQLHVLFSILGNTGRPRMTSLALRFLSVIDDSDTSESSSLDGECDEAVTSQTVSSPSGSNLNSGYFLWLQSLTLVECANAQVLLSIVRVIPRANTIRYLSFIKCTFDMAAFDELCAKLQLMKCLRSFVFRQCSLAPDCAEIFHLVTALEQHRHLAHFGISHLTTHRPKSAPNFLQLYPRDDTFLSHVMPHLRAVLSSNCLESLVIANSTLGAQMLGLLQSVVENNSTLTRLELPDCYIVPESYPLLCDVIRTAAFTSCITDLNLKGTELNPECFVVLSDVLRNTNHLRFLSLNIYSPSDMVEFSEGFACNRSLESLEMCKVLFQDDLIVGFSNGVARHPRLRTLLLSTFNMTPVKISILFQALRTCSSLMHIAMRNFHLEDLHMFELAEALAKNESLLRVDLTSNKIGPSGVDMLYKKLTQFRRSKLWKVNLADNNVKEFHPEIKRLKTCVLYLKVNWF